MINLDDLPETRKQVEAMAETMYFLVKQAAARGDNEIEWMSEACAAALSDLARELKETPEERAKW
jgi:hypothetical protein